MSEIRETLDAAFAALCRSDADNAWRLYEKAIRLAPQEKSGYLGLAHAKIISTLEPTNENFLQLILQAANAPGMPEFAQDALNLTNYGSGENRRTLLMYACENLIEGAIRPLLDLGANVHIQDSVNATALYYTAYKPHEKMHQAAAFAIVKQLLDAGADAAVVTAEGNSAYNKANDPKIMELIHKRFPKLEMGPVPKGVTAPFHKTLISAYFFTGLGIGALMGLMLESFLAAFGLAALLGIGALILGIVIAGKLEKNPRAKIFYVLGIVIFALAVVLLAMFIYFVSDGNFDLYNIYDLFFVPEANSSSSSGGFGDYQGWKNGYNPLTGRYYN